MVDNVRPMRPAREPWNIATDARPGARFVTPEQYRAGVPESVRHGMIKPILIEALARAADDEGVLLDFKENEFFATHVAAVLADGDEDVAPVTYDRFTAMVLMETITTLMIHDGVLANRGNGDSADYRLTLPTTS